MINKTITFEEQVFKDGYLLGAKHALEDIGVSDKDEIKTRLKTLENNYDKVPRRNLNDT